MCGRYTIKDRESINAIALAISEGSLSFQETALRWNIHPEDMMEIIRRVEEADFAVETMRWGMIPFWDKSPKPKLAPINARSGEAFSKPIFRQAIQKRRCLIPADGFYEWPKLEKPNKLPKYPNYYSLKGGQAFFFAGIFEEPIPEIQRPATYTIFTTEPNEMLLALPHERMPVILDVERAKQWMKPGPLSEPDFLGLCLTFPAEKMQTWRVSTLVNRPQNEGPECVFPIVDREEDPPFAQATFNL